MSASCIYSRERMSKGEENGLEEITDFPKQSTFNYDDMTVKKGEGKNDIYRKDKQAGRGQ